MKRLLALSLSSLLLAGVALAAEPAKVKAPKQTPEMLTAGKKVYEVNCLTCHGEKGDGNGEVGKVLVPKPRDFTKDPMKQGSKPEEVFKSVTEGVKDTPMVGWAQLSDEDRWAVTYYVLTMVPKPDKKGGKKSEKAAEAATPATPATPAAPATPATPAAPAGG